MFTRDLIEVQPVFKSLLENIDSKRVSHAQLFSHREGGLALANALAYTTYLLCENPSDLESCGDCRSCKAMKSLTHPDVQFVFPTAKTETYPSGTCEEYLFVFRNYILQNPYMSSSSWFEIPEFEGKTVEIKVKQYEAILKFLSLKAFYNSYKVVLIWCPESLNLSTANKLLKHIEEPEAKTLFLLVSENKDDIITTILSRTQRTHFPLPKAENIERYLIAKNIIENQTQAKQISEHCLGNVDLAIKKAQNSTTLQEIENQFIAFAKCSYGAKNSFDMLELNKICEGIEKRGKAHQIHFFKYLLEIMYEITQLNSGVKSNSTFLANDNFDLNKYSKVFDFEVVDKIIEHIEHAIKLFDYNTNSKFILQNFAIKFHFFSRYKNIPEFYVES